MPLLISLRIPFRPEACVPCLSRQIQNEDGQWSPYSNSWSNVKTIVNTLILLNPLQSGQGGGRREIVIPEEEVVVL